jgi:hypothetical protein
MNFSIFSGSLRLEYEYIEVTAYEFTLAKEMYCFSVNLGFEGEELSKVNVTLVEMESVERFPFIIKSVIFLTRSFETGIDNPKQIASRIKLLRARPGRNLTIRKFDSLNPGLTSLLSLTLQHMHKRMRN